MQRIPGENNQNQGEMNMKFVSDNYPVPTYTDGQTQCIEEKLDELVEPIPLDKRKCASCGQDLAMDSADIYDHHWGWWLTFIQKQWISFHCSICGYDTSLDKLGVPR
jgi:hypothetical protein